ncbi:unnamed protein product [Meganyctiphanes norvegica]|uniref:Centromere protein J C-terminal domain-containing protein n=1 Tax=Meganyctiphanes norvegica TaxID=48144 RepID=A0AAV2S5T2_MEGNR
MYIKKTVMEKTYPSQSEGDSPSMTLLMRLQQLRQWQEKQRANLQRSSSFQDTTSMNSSYESSLSISPSNIATPSASHSGVLHNLKSKPLIPKEKNKSSHSDNSFSYSTDSYNDAQFSCVSSKSSNSSPIPILNNDQFNPTSVLDISKSTTIPLSHLISSNAHSNDSEKLPTDQYKEQEVKELEIMVVDLEKQGVMKVEMGRARESASENNDSIDNLSFNSPKINFNEKGYGISSVDNDFLAKPTSPETINSDSSYPISLNIDTSTNSSKSIRNSEEIGCISAAFQDNGKEKYQNDNSEIIVKDSIKDGSNKNNIEISRNYKIYDKFDDIPIRTQSQNFHDKLTNKFENNGVTNKSQSPSVPKFSFLKKGVGSAANNAIDVDSGFGSVSSIPGNITKAECNKENNRNIKRKFLKKGEGTLRFGMKTLKLKKQNLDISNDEKITDNLKSDNLRSLHKDKLKLKNFAAQSPRKGSGLDDDKTLGNKQTKHLQLKQIPSIQYASPNIENYNEIPKDNMKYQVGRTKNQEVEELSAFEHLEEMADDSSFCSNSSTVIQLLQKGLRSASSTPLRSPAPFDFAESPIPVGYKNTPEFQYNQELLSLSQVLEQCKALVQLEKEGHSNITQADIDYLVESILSDQTVSVHSVSEYLKNLQQGAMNVDYSTNTGVHLLQNQKPRVHFREEGVDVHEYETPDSDSETTLTDMQSIDEEVTDMVTTSDLEALAHLNLHGMLEHVREEVVYKSPPGTDRNKHISKYYSEFEQGCQNNILKNKKNDSVQKILEFSPPRHPPNSASHLVWSIFGQENQNKNLQYNKKSSNLKVVPTKEQNCTKVAQKSLTAELDFCQKDVKKEQDSDKLEIDSHKTLLMAKICELENETSAFKKKNSEIKKLQDSVKLDQENLSIEREAFKKQMTEHENKLREAIDRERNRLWKERQELKQLNQEQMTLEAERTQSLEIVMLKEKLADVEEEMKKKESSHQFAVRKFMDKIKFLEQENKKLKVDLASLQTLEKENLNLKHQLDREKLGKKSVLSDKTLNKTQNLKKKVTIANAIKKSVEIKHKPKSINDINKELDNELVTNEKTNISIRDVYPFKNLNIEDIEMSTVNNSSKPKLQVKEVKALTSLKEHNRSELEKIPDKPSPLIEEAEESLEKYSSSTINNYDSTKIGLAQQVNVPLDVFKDNAQNMHSPGSVNIDFTENCRSDGTKEIIYANGNKKEIFSNGVIVMSYYNGDHKEQHKDKTVYIYGTDQTKHITFTDGKEIVEFPNGQKETTYPDGSSEVTFPDMSVKKMSKDGTEICLMKDGTVVRTNPDGSKVFEFPGGQREVHTGDEKRREYPDGTIKILYDDGRVETRYKNGRIRIKDSDGNILTDFRG